MPPKIKDLASLLRGVKVDALRDDLVNWRSWALTVRDVLQVQGIYSAPTRRPQRSLATTRGKRRTTPR